MIRGRSIVQEQTGRDRAETRWSLFDWVDFPSVDRSFRLKEGKLSWKFSMSIVRILPKNSVCHSLAFVLKGVLKEEKSELNGKESKDLLTIPTQNRPLFLSSMNHRCRCGWWNCIRYFRCTKSNDAFVLFLLSRTYSVDESIFIFIRSLHARGNRSENRRDVSFEFIDRFGIIKSVVSTKNVKHRIRDTFEFRSKHLPKRSLRGSPLHAVRSFDSQREEYRQKHLLDSTILY